MATEKYMLIRCDNCAEGCDSVDTSEMTERELRADLKKRLGWLSYKTEKGWRDVCPGCLKGGK